MKQGATSPLASILAPVALAYGAVIGLRNWRYNTFRSASRAADVPVISVGNITVGGTGKTPMVIEIVRRLRGLGRQPAIVTRGYKAVAGRPADEVLEFRDALPDTPVVVDADRVQGAHNAVIESRCDCIVLDDGFQHRRLRRELDVVLIDALNPWGGGRVLPAGRLREPLSELQRAQAVVITRSNQIPDSEVCIIERRIAELAPRAICLRSEVRATALVASDGSALPLDSLAGRMVLPICGIGNPATFLRLLDEHGVTAAAPLTFADHRPYSPKDLSRIVQRAKSVAADAVVTTRKDWVKLAPLWSGTEPPPLLRLDVEVRVLDTGAGLTALLHRAVGT